MKRRRLNSMILLFIFMTSPKLLFGSETLSFDTAEIYRINPVLLSDVTAEKLPQPLSDSQINRLNNPGSETRWHPDYGSLHRFFGYSTVLLVGIAAVSSSNESIHYGSAYAATAAAAASLTTGVAEYSERFDLEEGLFTSDNLHTILGTCGAILMTGAIIMAEAEEDSGHAGPAIAGGAAMVLSVVLVRWTF